MTRFDSLAGWPCLPLAWGLLACGPGDGAERLGEAQSFITVEEAVTAGCSTSQLAALSAQIIGQSNCNEPGAFSQLTPPPNVTLGGAVLPFLEEPARDALLEALTENPGTPMQINSMLRTVAQQYLLYRWFQTGTCGIGLAAPPGDSNHESGLAIDIQQYEAWRTILEGKGFSWLGASDPVHFDYAGPGAVDHRGLDVLAFQQLWNLNNPTDLIDEDGLYGPQTEARLQQAPAEGFAEGPTCGSPGDPSVSVSAVFTDANDRFADGPSQGVDDLVEGVSYQVVATVTNNGTAATTALTLAVDPNAFLTSDDTMFDVGPIAPGASMDVSIDVVASAYSIDTTEVSALGLTADNAMFDLPADVYSDRRWEWNGGRLEGWSSVAGDEVTLNDTALVVAAGSSATSPAVEVDGGDLEAVRITGTSDQRATLVVLTSDGEQIYDVDLATGEAVIPIAATTVTGLRIDASAEMTLDAVRLETSAVALDPETSTDGCSCAVAGTDSSPRLTVLWLAGAALFLSRRRG